MLTYEVIKECEFSLITPGVGVNSKGHLTYDGLDTTELLSKYGSPVYLMNEDTIRSNCRRHKSYMEKYFGKSSITAFASKALSFRQIYGIMKDEGMYADAVSPGEIYTALSAGFDASHLIFHGNNKTEADIRYALKSGVGLIVADSRDELDRISSVSGSLGETPDVLLRITPGIDPHTHSKISTGQIDSKFGTPISDEQADELVGYALSLPNVALVGFHYHIGSQINIPTPFSDAMENVTSFLKRLKNTLDYTAEYLNIGGGPGIKYRLGDTINDYDALFKGTADLLGDFCKRENYPYPTVITEPGRSIVSDAGITLYTVGSVKAVNGYKNYVSVDGGMTDNPRYTLYGAEYEAVVANKATKAREYECAIVGRCCESGDILIPNARIQTPECGDVIAVFNTGAYNYSMASNYNRIPRLPVIMIRNGDDRIAVRRESFEDLIKLDN